MICNIQEHVCIGWVGSFIKLSKQIFIFLFYYSVYTYATIMSLRHSLKSSSTENPYNDIALHKTILSSTPLCKMVLVLINFFVFELAMTLTVSFDDDRWRGQHCVIKCLKLIMKSELKTAIKMGLLATHKVFIILSCTGISVGNDCH